MAVRAGHMVGPAFMFGPAFRANVVMYIMQRAIIRANVGLFYFSRSIGLSPDAARRAQITVPRAAGAAALASKSKFPF